MSRIRAHIWTVAHADGWHLKSFYGCRAPPVGAAQEADLFGGSEQVTEVGGPATLTFSSKVKEATTSSTGMRRNS